MIILKTKKAYMPENLMQILHAKNIKKKGIFCFSWILEYNFICCFNFFSHNLLQKFNIDKYHFLILKFWMQFIVIKNITFKKNPKNGASQIVICKKRGWGKKLVVKFWLKNRITVAKIFLKFFFLKKKVENRIYTSDPWNFESKSNHNFI